MGGGIRFRHDERFWTTRSGIFYWIVEELAEEVSDPELAAGLREISEHNLGSLDLSEGYRPDQLEELRAAIARLPQIGEARLPETDGKAGVLAQLRELHARVREPSPGEPPDRRPA